MNLLRFLNESKNNEEGGLITMCRKFKYFGVIPMMLTTFFVTSIVTACNPLEGLESNKF